jgi:predicted MFS family arabinose efflux permease
VLLLPIGWLSDRLEHRTVLAPAMLLMAAALAWLPQAHSLGGLLLVSLCLHAGFAAWGMPSAALVLLSRGEHLARTLAYYRLLVDGAATIAPWLVGIAIEHYGYGMPAWGTAAVVAGTALLVARSLQAGKTAERSVTP